MKLDVARTTAMGRSDGLCVLNERACRSIEAQLRNCVRTLIGYKYEATAWSSTNTVWIVPGTQGGCAGP